MHCTSGHFCPMRAQGDVFVVNKFTFSVAAFWNEECRFPNSNCLCLFRSCAVMTVHNHLRFNFMTRREFSFDLLINFYFRLFLSSCWHVLKTWRKVAIRIDSLFSYFYFESMLLTKVRSTNTKLSWITRIEEIFLRR